MRKRVFLALFVMFFVCVAASHATIYYHWLVWYGDEVRDLKALTIAGKSYDNFSLPEGKFLIYTTYFIFQYDKPQGKLETRWDGAEVYIHMSKYRLTKLPFGLPPRVVTKAHVGVKFFRFNRKPVLCGRYQQEWIHNIGHINKGQEIRFTIGRREGENFARVILIDNHIMKWTKEFTHPSFDASGRITTVRHGIETNADDLAFKGESINLWFQYSDNTWELIPWGTGREQWCSNWLPCDIDIEDWDYNCGRIQGTGGRVTFDCNLQ